MWSQKQARLVAREPPCDRFYISTETTVQVVDNMSDVDQILLLINCLTTLWRLVRCPNSCFPLSLRLFEAGFIWGWHVQLAVCTSCTTILKWTRIAVDSRICYPFFIWHFSASHSKKKTKTKPKKQNPVAGESAFHAASLQLWNKLPRNIREAPTLHVLKSLLKTVADEFAWVTWPYHVSCRRNSSVDRKKKKKKLMQYKTLLLYLRAG